MDNKKFEKLKIKFEKIINKKGYLEVGLNNELMKEVNKIIDVNSEEGDELYTKCEDYLYDNYNCVADDISGYLYSKELYFEEVEDFWKHFNISEKQLDKRYKKIEEMYRGY